MDQLLFVLQNTKTQEYVKLGAQGMHLLQGSIITARKFKDKGDAEKKARTIQGLGKLQVVPVSGKPKHLSNLEVKVKPEESFDSVVNGDLLKQLELFHGGYDREIKKLEDRLGYLDNAVTDFTHYILIENFPMAKWMKIFSVLKPILTERSEVKKTIRKLNITKQAINGRRYDAFTTQSQLLGVDNQTYSPRTDLYDKLKQL